MSNRQGSGLSRRHAIRRIGTLMVGGAMAASGQALLLGGSAEAQTQANPLLGTWSTRTMTTRGEVTGVIFVTFRGDGRFTQRIVVPAGTVDYTGTYRLSADRRVLQSTYHDYAPKQECRFGSCYPVTPVVPMNQPISTRINWLQPNLFVSEDAGGLLRWVRQP